MFGINDIAAQRMNNTAPHTFVAMQHLFMAMEDCVKNNGKKSWLGKDKGVDAAMKFKYQLSRAIVAMTLDGLISEATSNEDVCIMLEKMISQFEEAFPTWVTAYIFAAAFLGDKATSAAAIGQARGIQLPNQNPEKTSGSENNETTVKCPACQESFRVPARHWQVTCPKCQNVF